MKLSKLYLISMLTLGSSHLFASSLTLETRSFDRAVGIDKTDYRAAWSDQSSAITTKNLEAFKDLRVASQGTRKDFISYFKADFSIAPEFDSNQWRFRAGLDAGHGGALYLDGVLLDKNTTDMWWAGSWSRSSEILSASGLNLSVGNHVLEMFWAESCCHGGATAQFSLDGGAWNTLSRINLNAVASTGVTTVPVPMTAWLLASGIVSIIGMQRKFKQVDGSEQKAQVVAA